MTREGKPSEHARYERHRNGDGDFLRRRRAGPSLRSGRSRDRGVLHVVQGTEQMLPAR